MAAGLRGLKLKASAQACADSTSHADQRETSDVINLRLHHNPRHAAVSPNSSLLLGDEAMVRTLDQLAAALYLIPLSVQARHINERRNDVAAWVEGCYGERQLAAELRACPMGMQMLLCVERFLEKLERESASGRLPGD